MALLPRQSASGRHAHSYATLMAMDRERAQQIAMAGRQHSKISDFIFLPTTVRGTVLPVLALSPLNWFTIAIYIALWILTEAGTLEAKDIPQFLSKHVVTAGTCCSWFLVFFANAAYARMQTQYFISMAVVSKILDAATVARTILSKARALQLVRYLNGAHLIAYMGLSSTYGSRQDGSIDGPAHMLRAVNDDLRLFTEAEFEQMISVGIEAGDPRSAREVISWALQLTVKIPKEEEANPIAVGQLVGDVLGVRQEMGKLYEYAAFPVPFFYVHLVYFLVSLYLPLATLAIFNECTDDTVNILQKIDDDDHSKIDDSKKGFDTLKLLGLIIVCFNNIYILGLRHIGRYFSDPYGDDVQDFRVLHFVTFAASASRRALETETPKEDDLAVEEAMASASFAMTDEANPKATLRNAARADTPLIE